MTVDVEDAINQTMRNVFQSEMKPTQRVDANTRYLLDLFSEFDVKATFFILGEVAEQFPELIKEISLHGHELGIHGYSHKKYYFLNREQAWEEIIRAKKTVEDISGKKVLGHRAPEFSINKDTIWVLDLLRQADIEYDSSIFPVNSGRYGWPEFNRKIHWFYFENDKRIIEAPLSTVKILGKEIPGCGGGYLRVFPYFITKNFMDIITTNRPANVYLHPYETDLPPYPDYYMKAIKIAPIKTRLHLKGYWFKRNTVASKLKQLLKVYKFDPLYKVINYELGTNLKH